MPKLERIIKYHTQKGNHATMKKSIKIIVTIAIMGIMLACAYWLGTMQAETITEVQTVTEIREVEKAVVPHGYIDTSSEEFYNNYIDMRQVVDFTSTNNSLQLYLIDGSGYYLEQ